MSEPRIESTNSSAPKRVIRLGSEGILLSQQTALKKRARESFAIENTNSRAPERMKFLCREGLFLSQQKTLDERAKAYFGQTDALMGGALLEPPSFDEQDGSEFSRSLLVGGVYAITLYYTGTYVPFQPKDHDLSAFTNAGGHPQPNVLVTPAIVTRRISLHMVEVFLDTAVLLSYGNGPRSELYRYILHRDGSVRYWKSKLTHANAQLDIDYDNDVPCEWTHHCPRWEYTRFPVLPSVTRGV